MTKPSLALCSAQLLTVSGDAPEWLHLVPAGGRIDTQDDRGPYRIHDYQALMAASLKAGDKLVLDENHSTDLAAPQGLPAPARGWITALQFRDNGIWGQVEWTDEGRRLVEEGAYRGISPVIAHRKDKTVMAIKRASLVNQPNFEGLTALHAEETGMDWKKKLVELLKLDEGAEDGAVVTALNAALDGGDEVETALQAALAPIAKAAGLEESAQADAIVAGIGKLKDGAGTGETLITSLQSQLAETNGELKQMKDATAKKDATAFIDGAIADGRVGVTKTNRDQLISMHMEDAAKAEALVNGMPKLGSGRLLDTARDDASDDLTPTQIATHATQYQKKLADSGQEIDFGTAVRHVQEGRHK